MDDNNNNMNSNNRPSNQSFQSARNILPPIPK